jgi:CheY-like chemotaxis protein
MSKTVLVADESVTIRSVAESLLRGEAYSVRSAADGQMALELARTERPDLVLVGEKLPGLSGAGVCQAFKAESGLSGVPIVFMRADGPGSAPPEADAVLTKPFSPQTLLETVNGLLGTGHQEDHDATAVLHEVGVADELIDQALGIDDVGPAPALEMEVNRGTELSGERPEEPSASSGEPEAGTGGEEPAFGALTEPSEETGEPPTVDPEPLEFSTQVGLEDRPATAAGGGPRDADLERALDLAFGASAPQAGSRSAPSPIETPASSLSEISLGDPDPPAPVESSPKARSAAAPPNPPASFTPLDEEGEPERPHDYDWFIKEMARESQSPGKAAAPSAPEPPRIEPVATEPEAREAAPRRKQETPPASTPGGPTKSTTGFEIEAEEMQASKRGYDEFISEFRKEIAKLEGALPAEPRREDTDVARHSASGRIALPDGEQPPAHPTADIRRMGDELIENITQKVARELAAKIDAEAVYALIEQKLKSEAKRGS